MRSAGVLVSPQFLFRAESPNTGTEPRLLDDYALASRLSYFLWGSMPDSLLFALGGEGKAAVIPEILKGQVARMLRNPKSFEFVQSFVEQWLRTRDLGQSVQARSRSCSPHGRMRNCRETSVISRSCFSGRFSRTTCRC